MNSDDYQKGDILFSTHRDLKRGWHPIVYLEGSYSRREFVGAMITRRSPSNKNIELVRTHFKEKDVNGISYIVEFDNNYLVPAKLIKFENWGPFRKVGELTEEGIRFFEEMIGNLEPETFANYFRRTNN